VRGSSQHVEALRDEVAEVLAPLGLRLSEAKTRVVDMRDGFDFLGFHIKWMRKRGTDKWFVYTFIADKPVREFKRKIRALTHRRSQVAFGVALTRINQIQRGWANYFRYAVAKHTFDRLYAFVWWRIITWVMYRHRMSWTALRRRFKGPHGWRPIVVDGIELFNIASVSVTRYRWRGTTIPSPWPAVIIKPPA
jgi:RNA-directed DNA polymerase